MIVDRQVDRQTVHLAVLAVWRLGYLQVTAKLAYKEMAVEAIPYKTICRLSVTLSLGGYPTYS